MLGASGVIVAGSSYNVEFLDGTCIALYSGCDSVSDFTFQSEAAALLASQALLDQVFLDGPQGLFDSSPELTNGCNAVDECRAITPFAINQDFRAITWIAINAFVEYGDVLVPTTWERGLSTGVSPYWTYAVWTPIPEPGTGLLMGLGLLGLSARKRREG